jgi:peptide/nickel transport system permease protein
MLKYKKTILGLFILSFILILSFLYPLYGPVDFNKALYIYDKNGKMNGFPPFPPSTHNILGSDRNGADILLMMIYGAKYTISQKTPELSTRFYYRTIVLVWRK